MTQRFPNFSPFPMVVVLFFTLNSCGKQNDHSANPESNSEKVERNLSTLLTSATSSSSNNDLESLLRDSKKTFPEEVPGAATVTIDSSMMSEQTTDLSPSEIIEEGASLEDAIKDSMEAEKALQTLEASALEHQRSIEELRKINAHKDKTIVSLSTINDELLSEIRRLKGSAKSDPASISSISSDSTGKVIDLRSEIKNLKNSLLLKSSEIKDLRMRNDSLEVRITSLEKSPSPKIALADPSFNSPELENSAPVVVPKVDLKINSKPCSLDFDAVVTSYTGKSKEAFYTEFFILSDDLKSILSTGGIELSDFSGVENYGELWARARKNSFLYPDMLKQIRSLLLQQVEYGNGKRIRTDINGAAKVEDLRVGDYFVIGNASLGQVGVSWNVPVSLNSGANKVSLTLANALWSQ